MVWGGITSDGKTPLVFVDAGVKINSDTYLKSILRDVLKPWSTSPLGIWSVVESGACPIRHQNSESLKAAITKAWQEMDTDYQRMICDAFMKRLRELKRFSVRLNVPI
ncbi:hypothetical protein ANCCEY_10958 [Ancylostoma ceylanicum]|uniref:Uncharacterized protein n=1 Tax=Ancylostoma ceylanicum TaxID=53326 RepID=A0A0D6LDH9_9BILA|nr:hypothetical protein ANCCEY_10958 [Ancylostoma ceylanicum]